MTKKNSVRSKNWTFTDFEILDIHFICEKYENKIRYCCWGTELTPTTNRLHHQGWIQFQNVQRRTAFHKMFGTKTMWCEPCKGNEHSNEKYTQKDNEYKTWGEFIVQGQRTDIDKVYLDIEENGLNELEISRKYPREHAKYHRAIIKKIHMERASIQLESLDNEFSDWCLREWQEKALIRLFKQKNRKITWVVDIEGNKGKSTLCRFLRWKYNAFSVRNGKSSDIAYAYDYQKIVVFDFTREQQERVNYQIIENFKDEMLFSPKYESQTKMFEFCQLIVFSNFQPDIKMLSKDRWDIMLLD